MNRLKEYQINALKQIFKDIDGELYLFGSKVDLNRKGGDVDILLICPNNENANLKTQLKLTRSYQQIVDEQIDIQILPTEDNMSKEQKIFFNFIEKQRLFL